MRLIAQRLKAATAAIGERLETADEHDVREMLQVETALPPPQRLPLPHFPLSFPPSLHSRFVGRADDLFRIHFALATMRGEPARSAALTGAVEGGGGFGKTRLALEYAWRFGPTSFPGGIFWLTADQTESGLQRQFHGMLRELSPGTPELHLFLQQDRDARKDLEIALNQVAAESPVLFIVDNLPHDNSELPPRSLSDYCPALAAVTVLVTTRTHMAEPHVHSLSVGVLQRSPSVELLTEGTGVRKGLSGKEWEEIAGWVGDLPLALEVLNSALRFRSITPAELLAKCRSANPATEIDRQMVALRGQVPAGSLRGVTEALALSYEGLRPEVRRAARMIAWFASEPIPVELFHALGKDIDTGGVRTALVGRSFLSSHGGHEQGVDLLGTMHRVTADYIRSRIRTPRADLDKVCLAIIQTMRLQRCADPRQWPFMNACVPHADGLFWRAIQEYESGAIAQGALAKLFARTAPGLFQRAGLVERIISVGFCARNLRYNQGLHEDARRYAAAIFRLAERAYPPGDLRIALPMLSLADVLRDKTRAGATLPEEQALLREAKHLEGKALEICRRALGERHWMTATAMSNLGVTLTCLGEFKEARRLLEDALSVQKESGQRDRDTITTMLNLASARWKAGDAAGGRELMARAKDLYQEAMGESHPDTLRALAWLASMEPDSRKKLELRARVVELYREPGSCGDDHPATLKEMQLLAEAHYDLDDYWSARQLFAEVLSIRQRVLGKEHPDTLSAGHWLASSHYRLGDYQSAGRLCGEVLSIRQRVLGKEHPDTLLTGWWLAFTHHELGDYPNAIRLFGEVLAIRQRVLGKEHPDTLLAGHRLAWAHLDSGNHEAAAQLFGEVRLLRRQVLGEKHQETLKTASALGEALLALQCLDEARELLERTLELRLEVHGPDDELTAFTYRALGQTRAAMGQVDEARDLLAKALDVRRRKLRARHEITTESAWDLFELLDRMGDPAATTVFEEHLRWLLDEPPEQPHPDVRRVLEKIEQHRKTNLSRPTPKSHGSGDV